MKQLFASDNASPVHPAILAALQEADTDHHISYGDDPRTEEAIHAVRDLFGTECEVFFTYNGTGANVSALQCLASPWGAIICNEMAHINEDEGGAPEAIGGFKLLGVHGEDGKLSVAQIEPLLERIGFEHTNQPQAISLTQVTEVGALYTPDELQRITTFAHQQGLHVHMDGARIANAAVAWHERSLAEGRRISPVQAMREITVDAGVDVISFGATKNGLMFGEGVVFFRKDLARSYRFIRKQTTQLHSKMRYIALQFTRYLRDELWYSNALAANAGAQRLSKELAKIPGVKIGIPTEANGVFAIMPTQAIPPLQEEFGFYLWDRSKNMVRLMVSWDTIDATIDTFLQRAKERCT